MSPWREPRSKRTASSSACRSPPTAITLRSTSTTALTISPNPVAAISRSTDSGMASPTNVTPSAAGSVKTTSPSRSCWIVADDCLAPNPLVPDQSDWCRIELSIPDLGGASRYEVIVPKITAVPTTHSSVDCPRQPQGGGQDEGAQAL